MQSQTVSRVAVCVRSEPKPAGRDTREALLLAAQVCLYRPSLLALWDVPSVNLGTPWSYPSDGSTPSDKPRAGGFRWRTPTSTRV